MTVTTATRTVLLVHRDLPADRVELDTVFHDNVQARILFPRGWMIVPTSKLIDPDPAVTGLVNRDRLLDDIIAEAAAQADALSTDEYRVLAAVWSAGRAGLSNQEIARQVTDLYTDLEAIVDGHEALDRVEATPARHRTARGRYSNARRCTAFGELVLQQHDRLLP